MSPLPPGTGKLLGKLTATPITGVATLGRIIGVATLSLVECLADCIHLGLASDIHELKDSLLTRTKAESDAAKAEAESMRIRAQALAQNKNLVEYEAVQKWNGALPTYTGGAMPFIQVK